MATNMFPTTIPIKAFVSMFMLALSITCATSARNLLEDGPIVPPVTPGGVPGSTNPAVSPPGLLASTIPTVTPGGIPGSTAPVVPPGATTGSGLGPTDGHQLIFFMHDILGGSNPSAKAVTGVVTNPALNGQVPFAKPNGAVLPINNGVPLNNGNNALINNNNLPFLTGLSGTTSNVFQNNNGFNMINGGGNNGFPVVNGGQLTAGSTLEKLMFGTLTAIDDELTEGHELGSGLVGKAQGFYVASSVDGTSQTMAFTALFESGGYADSISFFGVHRTAVSESQVAVMGGTGKYVNAKGFATVKTFSPDNQHTTDGVDTLLQFTVYLAY